MIEKPAIVIESEDGHWHVLAESGLGEFASRDDALRAIADTLPDDAPSPLLVDVCAQPERVVRPAVFHFDL